MTTVGTTIYPQIYSPHLFETILMLKHVCRVFEVSRHGEFCLIKKAYKLLSGAEETEVTITTLPHLT
jgi:hypothetical protein